MSEVLKNISQVKLRQRRGAVVFGEVVYAPGGVCGPRIQRDYQLVVLHKGEIDLRLDGRRINVAPRHAILLSPGHREHFLFSLDRGTHHSWCSIDSGAVPPKLRRLLRSSIGAPAPVDSRVESLLAAGKAAFVESQAEPNLENSFHLSVGLALLTGFALSAQAQFPAARPGDQALARAEQFIQNEFARRLSLADLAAAAGVSRQHLLKLFRLRRGNTPAHFLYERRLGVAAEQLAHTGLSLKEIAGRCGFANEFHFSRKFKHAYEKSPSGWRNERWNILHRTRR
ncbi:MAG TPA: AraC family transcriptional regulator [Candidatus Limnocylindrales bacterium]|nr:AraC family transcriptional regulator [Candidatus Limnocylindrales bacterium]